MANQSWDVFVSYAHADDEPPVGTATGWVTILAGELRKVLRRKLSVRELRIFMDHRLAANEGVTEALLDAVRSSRTLLVLMSPRYQKSRLCQWELCQFLETHTERNPRDHVFVIEIEPTDRSGWPPPLQELISICFWYREFTDKAPRPMGFPVPKLDEDDRYWRNLNELAYLIARQLEEPWSKKVWLAEPSEDLHNEYESVAATLRQQGFLVVPTAHLPREDRELYFNNLRDSLKQTVLGVQLLGPREGLIPAGEVRSFVALQAEAADEAARAHGLRVLRWRPRDLDLNRVTSESYRALLTSGSVLAVGIEEFKQEILRALSPQAKPTVSIDSSGAPHVYNNAEAVERVANRSGALSVKPKAPDTVSRPLRVFLCHSSADKPTVRDLYKRLRDDGFLPWLDEEDILGGQVWEVEIRRAVRTADIVAVCLSRGSITKRGYVQKEIRFALDVAEEQPEGSIYIIPVKLEECSVPESLLKWQWVSLFEEAGYKQLLRTLGARAGL
ncbi:MAG TPA: toll/interleukin-1 receptor domain-containing protein [Thermoanaerobaculia bacterium]|nr:toll/interleukin-1 receptor domain-containing protein [Thermoanaerobaculia bacterium]